MRITLVISSLGAGGSERVMSVMGNYWAEHGHDVTIITLSSPSDDWYKVHLSVRRVGVGLDLLSPSRHFGQAIRRNLLRVRRLREELRRAKPTVVISFGDTTNVLTLLASVRLRIPVIVSERVDPCRHPIGRAWNGMRSLVYRRADAVVVQSEAVREWAGGILGGRSVHVIPNPVNLPRQGSAEPVNGHSSGHLIVAMGRLVRQKGFDLLLEAFGRCARAHPGWSLTILGEGEERRNLETLAADLGITDRVRLAGQVEDPTVVLRQADLFVLSSRYEGFPNALLEAMACGVPVIAADCPSGPREIIRDSVDGVLVLANDIEALGLAMGRLMENEDKRRRLASRAVDVIERFGIERIMKMWDEVVIQSCRMANQ